MMTRDELAQIAVRVVAEQTARKAVRENLRRQGVKISYVTARDIIAQARAWLATHPEMIAEARAKAAELGYVADQGRPTHSHSKGAAQPQSLTEIHLPAAEKSTSVSGLADGEMGPMREDENEVCNFNFDGVLKPPRSATWRDVMRHSNACEMLARQAALKQAGPDWPTYFAMHRERLMNEASQLIARSWVLERWRLRSDGGQTAA
jgi:hypothetical protein